MAKQKKKTNNSIRTREMDISSGEEQTTQFEFSWNLLERTDSWISSCDSKLSILMGMLGVIVTILITSDSITAFCEFVKARVDSVYNQRDTSGLVFLIAIVMAFVFTVISMYHVINASIARINEEKYKQENLKTNSNLYFGTISKRQFKEYYKDFSKEDNEEQLRDIMSQVYINSCIANKKHIEYDKALSWFLLTLVYILILIVIANFLF